MSDNCVEIDKGSNIWCTWCNKQIVYGSRGKKDLMKHTKEKHWEHLNTRKESIAQPPSWLEQNPDLTDICCPHNILLDAAWNIHKDAICHTMHNTIPLRPVVWLNGCILHNKAFVLSFAVENNIPISKVLPLAKFILFLPKSSKALSELKLDGTLANYKLKKGMAQYNHKSVVTKLNSKHFF